MYTCEFCGKVLTNPGGFAAHKKLCKRNPEYVAPRKVECEFCGKSFYEGNAIKNHSNHCKCNPQAVPRKYYNFSSDYSIYVSFACSYCGKTLKSNNALVQHQIRCPKNPERIPVNDFKSMYQNYPDEVKARMNWNKGETKETNDSVRAYADKLSGRPGKPMTDDVRSKMSEDRIRKILEGIITPGHGKGYINSYIQYPNGSRKLLRSSYELIVAIFLDTCGIEFEYESIRVPYIGDDGKLHNFISDFSVGSVVIEVKGQFDEEKLKKEAQTFRDNGYDMKILYEADVMRIKNLLQESMDIKSLLQEVTERSHKKDYYTYELKGQS